MFCGVSGALQALPCTLLIMCPALWITEPEAMLQLCVPQCQVLINPIYHLILDVEFTQLINDHELYGLVKMETCPKESLIKINISYKIFISVQSFPFFCLELYLLMFISPSNQNNLFQ